MPLVVSNLQEKLPVDEDLIGLLTRVVEAALADTVEYHDAEVGLVFTDNEYIADLNRQYRNVDGPTDVLSFSMLEGEPVQDGSDSIMLGDIVISLEKALQQAKRFGHGLTREIAYLTVHGVLHLLGYNHETDAEKKVMREKEEQILSRVLLPEG
ncbi:rRNA maturation RNase YbeY [Desulfotruncus alcoholivorax]|uniref:rRNA maturation RNase YbeY n=1 Tax=Desulfotruncus alcoholivorax TaxID=265477 RepID=UPI00041C744D|nr:rRNA maturation RNase YbeY [Desulfotruncus alcoholivorax]